MFKEREFIQKLSELTAIESLPGRIDELNRTLDHVDNNVDKRAVRVTYEHSKAPMRLFFNAEETKTPDVMYLVHTDVVAGLPDQFEPKINEGKLFARGAGDMKFAAILGYMLMNEVIESGMELSFCLAVTTDEEVGGFEGAAKLASDYGYRPKSLVVLDGGKDFELIYKSKGIGMFRAEVAGKPAHECRPWEGHNGANDIVSFCAQLLNRYPEPSEPTDATTIYLDAIKTGGGVGEFTPKASVEFSVVFPESRTLNQVEEEVVLLAKTITNDFEIEIIASGDPTYTNPEGDVFKLFKKAAESVLGREIVVSGASSLSDARHFANQNVPILMTRPMCDGCHSDNEYVDLAGCGQLYEVLVNFVLNLANTKKKIEV